ncbi:MAG TPA: MarR family transcriptional regulator [Thermoleophilaceae bacterium]|nr:MarR family transcriptional regulator [Thermoleophilaceae bacterium]
MIANHYRMVPSDTDVRPPTSRPAASVDREPDSGACHLLMLRLGRAAAVRLGAALGELGMHPHEFAVLHALSEAGPVSQGRLGEELRVHASNLVAVIDGLEAEELVVRRRDPVDRRRYLVGLTARGRRRLEQARHAAEQVEEDLLAPLGEAERRRLHSYLTRVAANACAAGRGKGG